MRSLFLKIFLWFGLAMVLVNVASFITGILTERRNSHAPTRERAGWWVDRDPIAGCQQKTLQLTVFFHLLPFHVRIKDPVKAEALPSEYGDRVIYEALAEGGFQVNVPALPGVVTYGRTLDEAREMAQAAISCHIQGLLKDNEEARIN